MTTKVLLADEIGNKIHDIFAGEYFLWKKSHLYILSPWISNVEIKGEIPKMGYYAPSIGYSFELIDLAHAILLAKLLFEVEVNLITKPIWRNEKEYSNSFRVQVKRLLDFLDETGCNVFVNDLLHSKMLLTRKIAIVGSVNLTKTGLYDSEEIAVSIDDLENLDILERYAKDVINESEPYGYSATSRINRTEKFGSVYLKNNKEIKLDEEKTIGKVTRGKLYEGLGGRKEDILHIKEIGNLLSNIEFFYLKECITKLMREKPYKSEDEAMVFIEKVLARTQFPKIEFKFKLSDIDEDEYRKRWEFKHLKKKTRQREKQHV